MWEFRWLVTGLLGILCAGRIWSAMFEEKTDSGTYKMKYINLGENGWKNVKYFSWALGFALFFMWTMTVIQSLIEINFQITGVNTALAIFMDAMLSLIDRILAFPLFFLFCVTMYILCCMVDKYRNDIEKWGKDDEKKSVSTGEATDESTSEGTNQATTKGINQAPNEVINQAPNEVINQAPNEVINQAPNEVINQAPNEVINQAPNEVINQAPNEVINQAPNEVINQAPNEVINQAPNEVINQAPNEVINQAPNEDEASGSKNYGENSARKRFREIKVAIRIAGLSFESYLMVHFLLLVCTFFLGVCACFEQMEVRIGENYTTPFPFQVG